jgi:hypothetical protein
MLVLQALLALLGLLGLILLSLVLKETLGQQELLELKVILVSLVFRDPLDPLVQLGLLVILDPKETRVLTLQFQVLLGLRVPLV